MLSLQQLAVLIHGFFACHMATRDVSVCPLMQKHSHCANACHRLLRSSSAAPAVSGMSVVQTLLALMARAAQSGLDALVRHFMSVLAHDDMRAVATFRVQSGMGLLHLGVQSGKLAVLAALLEESDAELWQVSCCLSIRQFSFAATGEDTCSMHG